MKRGKERVNSPWQNDFIKYGRDAFKVYVLESGIAKENAKARESYWIEKYKATNPEYGYNIRSLESKLDFTIEDGTPRAAFEELIAPEDE